MKLEAKARLTASAGTKTFKIQFSYEDPSGKGRATSSVTLRSLTDAAEARHVFDTKKSKTFDFKRRYKNPTITRVTEVK